MRTLNFTLLTLLSVMAVNSLAFKAPQSKEYSKEFSVTEGAKLVVENKFGQVNIQNWDKKAISVYVIVKVDNGNAARTKDLLEAIDVTITQEGSTIKAITTFNEGFIRNNRKMFQSTNNEITIDYTIKMPANVDVDIENKFGDIFINELNGHLLVDLKYGNIKVNKLGRGDTDPLNNLNISYGNANINEANWIKTEVKYGKLEVENLKAAVILSRYSKISIGKSNSLVIDSKYDKFEIGTVNNLAGESGYTVFNIDRLNKKLLLSAKYGDVKIAAVDKAFESIVFNAAYTGLKAGIESNVSYRLNAKVSYGKVNTANVPSRMNKVQGNTSVELSGTVGQSANPTAEVTLNMKYGSATLY